MEQSHKVHKGHLVSDCLFAITITSIFVISRSKAFKKSYLNHKLTPFAKGVLTYERRKKIDSHIHYFQRTSLYILLASGLTVGSVLLQRPEIGQFGKGVIWGSCFGMVWVGIGLGLMGYGGNYLLSSQLKSLL